MGILKLQLPSVTFISQLNALDYTNLEVKIYVV